MHLAIDFHIHTGPQRLRLQVGDDQFVDIPGERQRRLRVLVAGQLSRQRPAVEVCIIKRRDNVHAVGALYRVGDGGPARHGYSVERRRLVRQCVFAVYRSWIPIVQWRIDQRPIGTPDAYRHAVRRDQRRHRVFDKITGKLNRCLPGAISGPEQVEFTIRRGVGVSVFVHGQDHMSLARVVGYECKIHDTLLCRPQRLWLVPPVARPFHEHQPAAGTAVSSGGTFFAGNPQDAVRRAQCNRHRLGVDPCIGRELFRRAPEACARVKPGSNNLQVRSDLPRLVGVRDIP